jgi:hypothetical protein
MRSHNTKGPLHFERPSGFLIIFECFPYFGFVPLLLPIGLGSVEVPVPELVLLCPAGLFVSAFPPEREPNPSVEPVELLSAPGVPPPREEPVFSPELRPLTPDDGEPRLVLVEPPCCNATVRDNDSIMRSRRATRSSREPEAPIVAELPSVDDVGDVGDVDDCPRVLSGAELESVVGCPTVALLLLPLCPA